MTPRAEKEPITRPSDRARGRVLLIADDEQPQFVEAISCERHRRFRCFERRRRYGFLDHERARISSLLTPQRVD